MTGKDPDNTQEIEVYDTNIVLQEISDILKIDDEELRINAEKKIGRAHV